MLSTRNYFQNSLKVFVLATAVLLSMSSCSKKPSGIRAEVKTQKNDLNASTSAQAEAQAASLNANYTVLTVSVPSQTAAGHTVNVELQTPDGKVLPVTTQHENGYLDSQGNYTDSSRGLLVNVQARCSSDNCYKYIVMVTALRNNQMVFQSVALSYKDDCKFYSVSSSANAGSFYRSITEADNMIPRQYPTAVPQNDCAGN